MISLGAMMVLLVGFWLLALRPSQATLIRFIAYRSIMTGCTHQPSGLRVMALLGGLLLMAMSIMLVVGMIVKLCIIGRV